MAEARDPNVVPGILLWKECKHPGVGRRDHKCPVCHGTMRRCCDSLIGHLHAGDCKTAVKRTAVDEEGPG